MQATLEGKSVEVGTAGDIIVRDGVKDTRFDLGNEGVYTHSDGSRYFVDEFGNEFPLVDEDDQLG